MRNHRVTLLAILFLALALPLQAQFRSEMRTADKEYELHAYNLAIESYQRALARRPEDRDALARIANSYRMLNQMQAAHTYYQQAVRDRKVDKEVILEHAHVLKALGRYEEAKQWYLLYARDHDQVVGNHFAQSSDFAMRQLQQDAGFMVQSSAVNSPVSDFGPTMPFPQQLVFNSSRTSAGGSFSGTASNQPYVAAIGADGNPQQAFPLRNGYTVQAGNVGPVSYSPDGRQVVFTRNNFTPGTRMIPEAGIALNLMIADVNQEGVWTNARPLPFNGTDFSTGFGTFSQDGNSIYFSSDRPEGFGGYDIYRANRQGQTWETVPENLGTVINSVGHEITPFFDGASLFFSSNWHHGMGAYDVFRAEMVNNRPSKLYHMGNGINSSRDDIGFIYDPAASSGYVVSNRIGGSGQEDVYSVRRANQNMQLLVTSATDGSVLPNAAVDFTSCGGQVYTTDQSGRYVFQSTEGLNCDIIIGAAGYQSVRLPLQGMQPDATNTVRVALNADAGGGGFNGPTTGIPNGVSQPAPPPPGTVRGYIANAQNGYPVMDALVVLTKRTTGQSANLRTNQDGAYIVALEPYTTYDMNISAPGFEGLNFPVTTADGSNQNILGKIDLLPGSGSGTIPPGGTVTNPPATPGATISGFSVQLGSFSKQPDLGKFSNLNDLGRVYDVNAGGAYKARLGVFATRAEADAAAASAKSRGYSGAFVTADNGPSAMGGGSNTYIPPTNPGGNTYVPPTNTTTSSLYKVQLGAFGKPENFNRNSAMQLGSLEQVQRGALTIFMIGGINSLTQAESVKAQARTLGYDGAFILQDVNGTLKKL